jgi:hypothetical protein
LLGARATLTDAPEAAKFNWRANHQWVSGTHSKPDVHGYFGLGVEQNHKTTFLSILTILRSLYLKIMERPRLNIFWQGSMDLQWILGIDSDVRNEFDNITVNVN